MHIENADLTKPIVISSASGPKTEAGKQISSRNALRHGCCANEALILKHENIADYKALEAMWFKAYAPKDDAEKYLVQDLVNACWLHQRANRAVIELEAFIDENAGNPFSWSEEHHRALARFQRYQTTRANNVARCQRVIDAYRKSQIAEKQFEEKSSIARQRLEIYREKNKPEPSLDELIQDLVTRKAEKDSLSLQDVDVDNNPDTL